MLHKIHPEIILAYGVIEPTGFQKETWHFNTHHLRRVRTILHLKQDLEVNLAGAALAVELIEEMEGMRKQIELLQSIFAVHR